MLKHFQSPGDSCRNKKHGKMRNNLFRDAALLVAAVLLTTAFWSCSKDEEPVPEPTPPAVSVTGVTLNKTSTSIQVGGTETLTATVSPKDAANKKVTWKSDKPTIAAVDANGKVTGVAAGEATITVTTEDGGYLQGNRQRNLRSGYGRNAQQDRNEYFCGRQRDFDCNRGSGRCHQPKCNVEI